jgi:acyl-CoA reductase-like NAD-dependent aldehyde dehydrogenase
MKTKSDVRDQPDCVSVKAPVRGHFIGGREVFVEGRELIDVRNPTNGDVIARIPHGSEAEVEAAYRSARGAFESAEWGGLSVRARARLNCLRAQAMPAHHWEWVICRKIGGLFRT